MGKLKRNKPKPVNKLRKKPVTENITNKLIKKRINAEKKITFQKQTLIQGAINSKKLVKAVQKPLEAKAKAEATPAKAEPAKTQPKKLKPVQKQKQRKKTSISDAKLLMKMMSTTK